jgi:hypothetical protein
MHILDYEDTVQIIGPDGSTRRAQFAGVVEPDTSAEAALGHSEPLLAQQRWLQVQVTTQESLGFQRGLIAFADGSRRDAEFIPGHSAHHAHVYTLKLDSGPSSRSD